jgi:hypothetical protein
MSRQRGNEVIRDVRFAVEAKLREAKLAIRKNDGDGVGNRRVEPGLRNLR